jgi:hypothetical protein
MRDDNVSKTVCASRVSDADRTSRIRRGIGRFPVKSHTRVARLRAADKTDPPGADVYVDA